ncbi:MAG: hypothetical protein K9W43_02215 [Candidatus Thorarchaeota archaeon]|nr:hypothetical protein [Candidatus Thorarchaeota archaeon]
MLHEIETTSSLGQVRLMKNITGAIVAIILTTITMHMMVHLSLTQYSSLPVLIAFLLSASSTLIQIGPVSEMITSVVVYLPIWLIAGLALGPLSEPGWNTVRSSIWLGTILAIVATSSILFTTPSFWNQPDRNLQLLFIFTTSLLLAQSSLLTAIPVAIVLKQARTHADPPIPEKIETICSCGAVYRSRPLICSACGKPLGDLSEITPIDHA